MFKSERKFRIWDYKVSHSQLLIRSPQSADVATNIDLVFWGVERIDLPTSFQGVVMLREVDGLIHIQSGGQSYRVAAGGFKVLENTLDIFESSLEGFAATEEQRNIGDVLAHS